MIKFIGIALVGFIIATTGAIYLLDVKINQNKKLLSDISMNVKNTNWRVDHIAEKQKHTVNFTTRAQFSDVWKIIGFHRKQLTKNKAYIYKTKSKFDRRMNKLQKRHEQIFQRLLRKQ
jgi:hypothetical protein